MVNILECQDQKKLKERMQKMQNQQINKTLIYFLLFLFILLFNISNSLCATDSVQCVYIRDWLSHFEFRDIDNVESMEKLPKYTKISFCILDTNIIHLINKSTIDSETLLPFNYSEDYRLLIIINYNDRRKDTFAFGNIIGMYKNHHNYIPNINLLNVIVENMPNSVLAEEKIYKRIY